MTQKLSKIEGFTLVEMLVVILVISVLSAVVTVSVARGSLEQRTAITVQSLQEVRSSISLFRVGAVVEGTRSFPSLLELTSGSILPSGQIPANPFLRETGVGEIGALAAAESRTILPQPVGWVYFASSGMSPVALFYANSTAQTGRVDSVSGTVITANAL